MKRFLNYTLNCMKKSIPVFYFLFSLDHSYFSRNLAILSCFYIHWNKMFITSYLYLQNPSFITLLFHLHLFLVNFSKEFYLTTLKIFCVWFFVHFTMMHLGSVFFFQIQQMLLGVLNLWFGNGTVLENKPFPLQTLLLLHSLSLLILRLQSFTESSKVH